MVSLFATAGEAGFPRSGGWDKARTDVRAVISVAATYELNSLSWGNLWTPVTGNVEDARRHASPITHVSASTKPLLVIHSDDDKSVPVQQAHDMAAKLKAAGVQHRYVHYTDRGHMGITDEVIKEARAFIAEVEQKKLWPVCARFVSSAAGRPAPAPRGCSRCGATTCGSSPAPLASAGWPSRFRQARPSCSRR
jgi:hypothetical protein